MRTVYKYEIEETGNGWFELPLPADAKIVLAGAQMGKAHVWVELDPAGRLIQRRFQIIGTGRPIADGHVHVLSFTTNNAARVWHLYEARRLGLGRIAGDPS